MHRALLGVGYRKEQLQQIFTADGTHLARNVGASCTKDLRRGLAHVHASISHCGERQFNADEELRD